ncbi:MAG: N-acetylmuramoyl-L-alanine amidase-like domain-containing protein [Verrucomicrobiota bacterium]
MPSPVVHSLTRRNALAVVGGLGAAALFTQCTTVSTSLTKTSGSSPLRKPRLPWSTVFVGASKFDALCQQAKRENWASLPIGKRTATVGKALCGTPYVNYTLEIDDRIESPSVNFDGLDCWTFYEASLAMARMVKNTTSLWSREALLHYIELERYRNGHCDGTYVSRMHHLEEVFADNERRGLGLNVTASLGGVPVRRQVRYMSTSTAVRNSRYLRNNPSMVPQMAKVESYISTLPITYIPKSRVAGIEHKLQDGDVLAILSNWHSSYTSHVGLAKRDGSTCRFMHATSSRSKGRQCIVDSRISRYLREKSSNMGLIVFRPGEAPLIG